MSSQYEEPIVITDKRRLDPETGEARVEQAPPEPAGPSREDELLDQLQRVTAEYANFRKRVDRDRELSADEAKLRIFESLLPLLDGIELARQHGDLEGAFKSLGEGLEQVADRHGFERYGAKGDVFDPAIHHALVHAEPDPDATVTVVAEVLQAGWRLRSGRVLRPAGVAVSDPVAAES